MKASEIGYNAEQLKAERDEAVRLCAVHKEDAMREIAEANAQAAKLDEAVALLRKWQAYADNESDMPLEETDAFLAADSATHRETPVT